MKTAVAILIFTALCVTADAQLQQPDTTTARSKSGQFVVRGTTYGDSVAVQAFKNEPGTIVLQPPLLVISCERIRQAVWEALGVSGQWSGTVFIGLRPTRNWNDQVRIVGSRFNNAWSYQLDMPQTMNRRRYLNVMVQVTLLELANRNAGARSAEIPAWLTEGLAQHLIETSGLELMINPPTIAGRSLIITPTMTRRNPSDPLEKTRKTLRENPQFTLEQLSWPTEAQLSGADKGVYRDNAQVFVAELLRLKDGPACLMAMLKELPECYNWQTAFLRAFKPHFSAMLDLEKWWALQVIYLTGRDPTRLWTLDESWRKLDHALLTPAQSRNNAHDLPSTSDLDLQTVITEWDYNNQKKAITDKVRLLDLLRMRLAPDPAVLAVNYRDALSDYLKRRQQASYSLTGTIRPAPTVKSVTRDTVKALNELDAKRSVVRSRADSTAATSTPAP